MMKCLRPALWAGLIGLLPVAASSQTGAGNPTAAPIPAAIGELSSECPAIARARVGSIPTT